MSPYRSVLTLVALLVVIASPVAAQTIEAGPLFGYFRPTGRFEPATVSSTVLPGQPNELSGAAWGAEARMWFGARAGVQLQATAASSTIRDVATLSGITGPTTARVSTITAQMLYNFSPSPRRYRLWLSGGGGVVRHEGSAYSDFGSPIDLAGVLGAGATLPITRGLRVTAGASTTLYPFELSMPPQLALDDGPLQKGFQRDVLFHFGLSWSGPAAGKE
jgi:hypothetical protein